MAHLRLGDEHFRLAVKDGHFRAKRAEPDDADVVITTTAPALQSLVHDELTLAEAEQSGDLTIAGDRVAAEHLFMSVSVKPTAG